MKNSRDLERVMNPSLIQPTLNYLGDFPLDQLPPPHQQRHFSLIVNSDVAGQSGSHWMALCLPPASNGRMLYIDPLALSLHQILPPLRDYLKDWRVECLPFRVQPLLSTNCGIFCAYILSLLPLYNYNLSWLAEREFDASNLRQNDQKVARWWYKRVEATS